MPNYFPFATLKRENNAKFISLKHSAFDKKICNAKKREVPPLENNGFLKYCSNNTRL